MAATLQVRATYSAHGSPDSPIEVAAQYGNFIGGAFVAPVDGKYRQNRTPVTGEVICEVADSTPADIELSARRRPRGRGCWAARSPAERSPS
jgi:aldehyde dehydrogenase